MDDVKVLYQVFRVMIDDLPLETVLDLLEESSSSLPEVMPFGKHQGKPLGEVPPDYISWLKKQGAFDKPDNASLKSAFEIIGVLS